jgi:hypothetical protein
MNIHESLPRVARPPTVVERPRPKLAGGPHRRRRKPGERRGAHLAAAGRRAAPLRSQRPLTRSASPPSDAKPA